MALTPRIAICLAAIFLSPLVIAPASADAPLRKVTVTGNATIKVVPDEMLWTAQVNINDATLAAAKERHDTSLSAALKYIRSLGDAVKDLQTGGIRYQKNPYSGPDPDSKKTAFSCWTQFTFTLTNFDKYGPIADALSQLDGIQVQSVDYASSQEEEKKGEALKQALINAHDKAGALAATASCYIDKPLEIVEGTPDNGPRPMMLARTLSVSNTPEAVPGQLEISAAVTATYDLYYK